MRIKAIKIENFRGFNKFSIDFPENNLAVFIGNNGKGKSSLLDAVAILLTPLVNQLSTIKGSYSLSKNDINKQKNEVLLGINVVNNGKIYDWQLFKNGRNGIHNLTKIQEFGAAITAKESQMPILVYYKSTRTTISVEKTKFETPLEVYDYGFSKNTHNFYGFITWFRLEEDKENEQIRRARDFNLLNPQLEIIRKAIPLFFKFLHQESSYTNLRINREARDKKQ